MPTLLVVFSVPVIFTAPLDSEMVLGSSLQGAVNLAILLPVALPSLVRLVHATSGVVLDASDCGPDLPVLSVVYSDGAYGPVCTNADAGMPPKVSASAALRA
jgi:hypothetical protein